MYDLFIKPQKYFLWLLVLPLWPARAEVRLPKLVGDNMILQRDTRATIFGSALRVERVTVVFLNKVYAALPDEHGEWVVSLPPLPAGGPHEMEIFGKNTLKISNILVGDVWLAAGQGNMEQKLADHVLNNKTDIANADYPDIRFVDIANTIAARPRRDYLSEGWRACSPKTAGLISATAFFFARNLFRTYHVPIGIIQADWADAPAEAWLSTATLKQFPEFKEQAEKLEKCTADLQELHAAHTARLEAWRGTVPPADRGYSDKRPWYEKKINDEHLWRPMKLPCHWEEAGLGGYDGAVWFRKTLEVPRSEAGQPLTLSLGRIEDEDIVWVNGVEIGRTAMAGQPRRYTVPGPLVKAGQNLIVVRVLDRSGGGGIAGYPAEMRVEGLLYSAPLAGQWQCRPAIDVSLMPRPPAELRDHTAPGVVFNGMVAAVVPYTLKGVVWYQGEANTGRAYQYRNLFPALIRDWRAAWRQKDDFPFLFVQLAGFRPAAPFPAESEWAELREAQAFALNEPKTAMAVAIDIAGADEANSPNKQEVGRRLALAARRIAYADTTVREHAGPLYKTMIVENNRVRLLFDFAATGLVARKGALKGFAVAGADKKFIWANARIDGSTVVVWSELVAKPVAVRYAWADNPSGCNLYNAEGLPAAPFRTDQWRGLTFNIK